MTPTLIVLDSVGSTSSYMASALADAPQGTLVVAREQTAGRGQRGNTWEAAPGQNVTMSLMLRPEGLAAREQFVISQAVSLAVVDMLDDLLVSQGHKVSIKWPNDIYAGDRKICGILIENDLVGASISRSIVGLGLNVNQRRFFSPAPNPVSLRQLTGIRYDSPQALAVRLAESILTRVDQAISDAEYASAMAGEYRSRLWRGSGVHRFHDNLRGVDMTARIDSVAPSGEITLIDHDGLTPRVYSFKELSFIL